MNFPGRLSRIYVLGCRYASQKQPGEIFKGSYEEYMEVTAAREKLKSQNRFNKKDYLRTGLRTYAMIISNFRLKVR